MDNAAVIIDVGALGDTWCAFEHLAVLEPGRPPEVIMVGACPLVDVFRLREGRENSEWAKMFRNGGHLMIRIVHTEADRSAVRRFALEHSRKFDPMPRCNVKGFRVSHRHQPIKCEQTGKRYKTQKQAADDLGLTQSAISRHMKGELAHVKGFVFRYAGGESE